MSDLRARLADALNKQLDLYGDGISTGHMAMIVDVLLSLPGIAIVELPEPGRVKPGLVLLNDGWCAAWRARELAAALLASADAAERGAR